MQATTVATVNSTYDWVAAEAKRVMREVLGVRAKERTARAGVRFQTTEAQRS